MIMAQLIVKGCFLGVQARKRPGFRLSFNPPERSVGKECLPIHQKRHGMRQKSAQLVENGKTVGIDVSEPVLISV